MNVRNLFVFLTIFGFSCCLSLRVQAQIVDDSTRQIYSPRTTRIIYEQDFLQGQYRSQIIDTTLTNMHRERFWYRDTTFYQDLGNIGTASHPVLWRFPNQIGARLGKRAFERFYRDPAQIAYYDTRSPYSHLWYVQGTRGEQVFEAKYSRNVSPNWNIGFAYDRISANKQLRPERTRDGQVDHFGLLLFTHYRTPDSTYQLFANAMHQAHVQIESGGVRLRERLLNGNGDVVREADTRDSLYRYGQLDVFLSQAANREVRNSYRLAHSYRLAGEGLKVFHVFDSRFQKNFFSDNQLPRLGPGGPILFYPPPLLDTLRTQDITRYLQVENSAGISGASPLYFYKLYLKRRDISYTTTAYDSSRREPGPIDGNLRYRSRFSQHFAGLDTRVNLPNRLFVRANGEFQFSGDYRAEVALGLPFLWLSRSMISYEPALVEQVYLSNHFRWRNSFTKSLADRTGLHLFARFSRQWVKLDVTLDRITNYVFFNEQAKPEQYSPTMRIYSASLHHHIRARNLHFDNILTYTNTDQAPKIQVPSLLLNSKLYYEGPIYKNALFGQLGIDTYFTTRYYPYAYMPVTQQFFLQNSFPALPYPVVDVFLAADIKSVNLFVKVHHVNQGLMGARSYTVTPFYPALQRSIQFGVKWLFFD